MVFVNHPQARAQPEIALWRAFAVTRMLFRNTSHVVVSNVNDRVKLRAGASAAERSRGGAREHPSLNLFEVCAPPRARNNNCTGVLLCPPLFFNFSLAAPTHVCVAAVVSGLSLSLPLSPSLSPQYLWIVCDAFAAIHAKLLSAASDSFVRLDSDSDGLINAQQFSSLALSLAPLVAALQRDGVGSSAALSLEEDDERLRAMFVRAARTSESVVGVDERAALDALEVRRHFGFRFPPSNRSPPFPFRVSCAGTRTALLVRCLSARRRSPRRLQGSSRGRGALIGVSMAVKPDPFLLDPATRAIEPDHRLQAGLFFVLGRTLTNCHSSMPQSLPLSLFLFLALPLISPQKFMSIDSATARVVLKTLRSIVESLGPAVDVIYGRLIEQSRVRGRTPRDLLARLSFALESVTFDLGLREVGDDALWREDAGDAASRCALSVVLLRSSSESPTNSVRFPAG